MKIQKYKYVLLLGIVIIWVVKIAKGDFNKEMSSYIKHKRKAEPWYKSFSELFKFERRQKPVIGNAEEQEGEIMEKEVTAEQLVDEVKSGEMSEEEIKEDYEQHQKKGFFARFFGNKHEADEIEENEAYVLDEDIKRVLKIQNDLVKKLPPEEIKKFKDSEDFIFYKETLKRYNLIKDKK